MPRSSSPGAQNSPRVILRVLAFFDQANRHSDLRRPLRRLEAHENAVESAFLRVVTHVASLEGELEGERTARQTAVAELGEEQRLSALLQGQVMMLEGSARAHLGRSRDLAYREASHRLEN